MCRRPNHFADVLQLALAWEAVSQFCERYRHSGWEDKRAAEEQLFFHSNHSRGGTVKQLARQPAKCQENHRRNDEREQKSTRS